MTIFPPAKINIGLLITGKRPDGFHDIETIFYPIGLTDILDIVPSERKEKISFECSGIELDGNPVDNLCCKAYHMLDKDFDLPPVSIRLNKRIPAGAGLGGGSSDAAHTLLALNELFSLNLSIDQLTTYASRLGSDCAFFLSEKPALGIGKGDQLQPVSLSLAPYHLFLVKPPVSVSTAQAYASVTPRMPEDHLIDLVRLSAKEWKNWIINDFEQSVFAQYPEIEMIKQKLYDAGAIYASMSGSGSCVYGLFEKTPTGLEQHFPHCFIWTESPL